MGEIAGFNVPHEKLVDVAKQAAGLPFKLAGLAIGQSARLIFGAHAASETAELASSANLADARQFAGHTAIEANADVQQSNVIDIASKRPARKRAPKTQPAAIRSARPGRDRHGREVPHKGSRTRDSLPRSERYAHLKDIGD